MSKKRGLSLEEKRGKILEIFYESQDFYLLKELEKLGPKKGVITQSVKDVVQSLVDDDLVLKDKIGTSLRNVYRKLESDLQSSKKRHTELVEQCNALKKGREESDEREEALEELKAVELKHIELKLNSNLLLVILTIIRKSADNIFTLQQWCSNNFPQAKEELEQMYKDVGIPEDFDYLELSPVPLSSVGDQTVEGCP
ncbi:Meiotic nuclear division protein 1-like [Citrus sinensis]|uniref:Meiotic nuclear division protein 1-like n=1 Tax=Citrus sinensis TaxID=2711 RepID=A0ACB8NSL0_CITSI|nr:Meiotic nuclear division protein 1-like [Citrus sinensis]KAH9801153.1 Meiotic nuclear division protein 1-like [Citrus sinensis]